MGRRGLTTGVASALRAVSPETGVYVCEPETGAPVAAAIANGRVPTPVAFTPSFVDGAGSGSLLPEMWAHAEPLVTDAFAISLAGLAGGGRVVCIVSGGNLDASRLAEILHGRVPD